MIFGLLNSLMLGAIAQESPVEVHADLKSFFITGFPYEHIIMPDGAYGQGFVDGRLKVDWQGRYLQFQGHHAITLGTPPPQSQLQEQLEAMGVESASSSLMMTGVGLQAPEAIELSWRAFEEDDLFVQGRTDRFYLQGDIQNVTFRLGRQPISFGHGMMFNPMDLVQPFSVATIDSEYKPGLDALRLDGYLGMTTQLTGVVAYSGSWDVEGMTAVLNLNNTIAWTDISLFGGLVRSDRVIGVGLSSSIAAVGLHSDVTLTFPNEDDSNIKEDPFVRAVLGSFWQPFEKTTLSSEYYYQSLGASKPNQYLDFAQSDRYARGETWLLGQQYLAISVAQQFHPLMSGNIGMIGNLLDRSFLLSPSFVYSVSDEVSMVMGGYMGIGKHPLQTTFSEILLQKPIEIQNEFGMMSVSGFMQIKTYY